MVIGLKSDVLQPTIHFKYARVYIGYEGMFHATESFYSEESHYFFIFELLTFWHVALQFNLEDKLLSEN